MGRSVCSLGAHCQVVYCMHYVTKGALHSQLNRNRTRLAQVLETLLACSTTPATHLPATMLQCACSCLFCAASEPEGSSNALLQLSHDPPTLFHQISRNAANLKDLWKSLARRHRIALLVKRAQRVEMQTSLRGGTLMSAAQTGSGGSSRPRHQCSAFQPQAAGQHQQQQWKQQLYQSLILPRDHASSR